jgi:hypothetical protein
MSVNPMTLEELDKASPVGLRHARIRSLVRDHHAARLTLRVKIVVSLTPGASNEGSPQPIFRDGEICFHGVQYVVAESPSPQPSSSVPTPQNSPWDHQEDRQPGLQHGCRCAPFTFTRTEPPILPEPILSIRCMQSIDKFLPPETLRYSLSIEAWQTKVNIAAREVSFNWSSLK